MAARVKTSRLLGRGPNWITERRRGAVLDEKKNSIDSEHRDTLDSAILMIPTPSSDSDSISVLVVWLVAPALHMPRLWLPDQATWECVMSYCVVVLLGGAIATLTPPDPEPSHHSTFRTFPRNPTAIETRTNFLRASNDHV